LVQCVGDLPNLLRCDDSVLDRLAVSLARHGVH
jgi:hypothetical protein